MLKNQTEGNLAMHILKLLANEVCDSCWVAHLSFESGRGGDFFLRIADPSNPAPLKKV